MEKYEIEIRTASEWKAMGVCVGSSIKEYIRFLSEVKVSSLKGKSTSLSLGDWVWETVDCAWKGLDYGWRRMTRVWQRSQCHRFGDQHLVDEIWERNFGEKKISKLRANFSILNFLRVINVQSEKAMATNSSTPAWKIPWMEGPSRLQSMGSRRVGHD